MPKDLRLFHKFDGFCGWVMLVQDLSQVFSAPEMTQLPVSKFVVVSAS
jgi:hypothetical protein